MNLIVTVNSNYIRPLKIMLLSFMEHNPGRHKVYFLYGDVTEAELGEVGKLVSLHGSCMIPIRMEQEIFADMPVMQYFTKEMYYRLLAGQMLSQEEKRALYLDPDILVRGSLEAMYEQNMEGMILAGVEDYAVKTLLSAHKKEIGFGRDEPYINSGVLLMDLNRLRENFSMKELYGIMERGREVFTYPDQDIINLMFRGKIKILERKYNYNTGYGSEREMLKYLAGGFAKEKKYPVIVHYMGKAKPWHPDYYGKFGKEYRRYLKKVPEEEENETGRLLAVAGHLLEIFKRKLGGR